MGIYTPAHSCVLVLLRDISHWLLADQYCTLLPYHVLPILKASLGSQCPSESHVYGGNSTIRCNSDLGKLLCFQVLDSSVVQGTFTPGIPEAVPHSTEAPPQLVAGTGTASAHLHPGQHPGTEARVFSAVLPANITPFSTLGPPHCCRRLPGLVMSPLNLPKIQNKESLFISL